MSCVKTFQRIHRRTRHCTRQTREHGTCVLLRPQTPSQHPESPAILAPRRHPVCRHAHRRSQPHRSSREASQVSTPTDVPSVPGPTTPPRCTLPLRGIAHPGAPQASSPAVPSSPRTDNSSQRYSPQRVKNMCHVVRLWPPGSKFALL